MIIKIFSRVKKSVFLVDTDRGLSGNWTEADKISP